MPLRQLDEEKSHVCELEQEVGLCEEEVRTVCTHLHMHACPHTHAFCTTVVSRHRLWSGQVTVAASLCHCS